MKGNMIPSWGEKKGEKGNAQRRKERWRIQIEAEWMVGGRAGRLVVAWADDELDGGSQPHMNWRDWLATDESPHMDGWMDGWLAVNESKRKGDAPSDPSLTPVPAQAAAPALSCPPTLSTN